MDTSSVGVVKAKLVELISAALPTLQVSYTRPPVKQVDREAVWLAEATGAHELATIRAGRKPRTETYRLSAVVSVRDPDDGPTSAETRALVLLAAIEDVLANDPRLGLAGAIDWASAGEFESRTDHHPEGGALAEIRLRIDVHARLS